MIASILTGQAVAPVTRGEGFGANQRKGLSDLAMTDR